MIKHIRESTDLILHQVHILLIVNQNHHQTKRKKTPKHCRQINEYDDPCEDKDDVKKETKFSPVDYKLSKKLSELHFHPRVIGFVVNKIHKQDVQLY